MKAVHYGVIILFFMICAVICSNGTKDELEHLLEEEKNLAEEYEPVHLWVKRLGTFDFIIHTALWVIGKCLGWQIDAHP